MVTVPLGSPQAALGARVRTVARRVRSSASTLTLRFTSGSPAATPTAPVDPVPRSGAEAVAPAPAAPGIAASDGVPLHAEVTGDPRSPVTVVLAHGFLADNDFWHFQRSSLARSARVVSYDHRGHGRSEMGGMSALTLDQLGALQYGSNLMNVTGDRTVEFGCATLGYDDEGVATSAWDIVRDGVLVGYQLDRRIARLTPVAASTETTRSAGTRDQFETDDCEMPIFRASAPTPPATRIASSRPSSLIGAFLCFITVQV